MHVKIYSRKAMEQLMRKGFPAHTAVVSFYDPQGAAPVDYTGVAGRVFQLAVDDVQTALPEAAGLAAFLCRARADGLDIICQCGSGQSRSAGCAAAILKHFAHSDSPIFDDDRYCPEMVYDSVLAALEKAGTA